MAIVDIDDTNKAGESRPQDIPRRLYRNQEELGTSTLFSKDHTLDQIVQYIKGMKWTVEYFLQIRNINDELVGLDINVPATIQKYHRISKLIITLQSAISHDNIENIEGDGVINAGILPNKYDVFLATLTGGRQALFTITDVDLRKYSLHNIYYVKFKLLTFVDNDNVKLYDNLIFKTVREYIYDKSHLLDYSAPVILRSDYNRKLSLKDHFKEITDYYFDNFISYSKNVLSPPTKSSIYTDTFLQEFIFKIINQEDSDKLYKLTRLDPDKPKGARFTIWDAVIARDPNMLKRCERHIGFKYMPYSTDSMRARQFNYLGVTFVADILNKYEEAVNPEYVDLSTKNEYFPEDKHEAVPLPEPQPSPIVEQEIIEEPIMLYDGEGLPYRKEIPIELSNDLNKEYVIENEPVKQSVVVSNTNAPAIKLPGVKKKPKVESVNSNIENSNKVTLPENIRPIERPTVKPVKPTEPIKPIDHSYEDPIKDPDSSYVLSEHFYKQDRTCLGIVERALLEYMRGEIINSHDLDKMINQYHMWSTKDQYYCIPLLLIMIKDGIINTFKSL